jgi:dihydrofolate synthase/folylpolyglutamate synthase
MESGSLLSTTPSLSYEEALAFWFGRINYEQRTPGPTDLKLDRMRTLLGLLGDPQEKLRIVHVAGSKGKGSTSAMLESILRQAGYRTGLFTSPHLCQVEERIQVNGTPIQPLDLAALMEEIRVAIAKMEEVGSDSSVSGQAVTFFEVATALGFLCFARRNIDVAIVEVGLGGRFDSTNVCNPLVSVITSISLDHTQQLGDRLASIAMEKAGIIKPGRPTISGVTTTEARNVIESTCLERNSDLRQLGRDFFYEYEPGRVGKSETKSQEPENMMGEDARYRKVRPSQVRIKTPQRDWPVMELGLLGEHQATNAAVAVACIEQLRESGLRVDDQAVQTGLKRVNWPARMEIIRFEPIVVLDCAHNVASAQALVDTLRASFPPTRSEIQGNGATSSQGTRQKDCLQKRLLIVAGSSDKDLAGILQVLTPPFAHVYLTRYSHSPRAVPVERLAEILRQQSQTPFTLCPTPADAWRAARETAGPDDLICITGSVFLAGELRPLLLKSEISNPKSETNANSQP